ncbi:RluA family pseudouridine synthase [Aquibacillus koreensis]|uniref:Pseudouridine synthase n=1 Tax=Aquibacillus koreensis TaxID=279446 RepID=A0A9X3WHY2_9BACI|nr:RluA family pseudouridine synthase [Aquibacillus koreensis]MCT2535665.1 RluA family pseudouridine synthase [Aquibacillus koreensis]MDC3420050.1 RluA family pseudouridine synthase [Aquibacillus koreensis]
MKWIVAKEYDDILLREYLLQIRGLSRRILKVVKFKGGDLLVNGESSSVRRKLHTDDVVEVVLPPEERGASMEPEDIPLDIVYEDDDVLVINKPPGMATIPSLNHTTGSLANGILGYYEKHNLNYTVHVVTRLDRDTSGLLLVAKHRYSHSILSRDQKEGTVNRRYYAVIQGELEEKQATIDAPIGRKPGSIIERMVTDEGQRSVTHYNVVETSPYYSLLDVKLETGRTHQIRVHFAYLGYPLVGDNLYGGNTEKLKRQALHCKSLAFYQPITRERLTFKCKMPEDMRSLFTKQ